MPRPDSLHDPRASGSAPWSAPWVASRIAAQAFGLAVALVVAWYVAHIPVQVTDSLGNMLEARVQTYRGLFVNQLVSKGFLRPLLWVQIKAAYDLAGGHYWLLFKMIHAVQLAAAALLLVRLCGGRSFRDAAWVPLVLAVLFGLHTFDGTVREAHPINAFLSVIVSVLAAMNLSISRPAWWKDALVVLILLWMSLVVETGLLVAVAVVAGRLVGLHGVSRRGVAVCLAVVAAYLVLRFGLTSNGLPGLVERSTGFGFRVLDPPELIARFGDRRWALYGYNVLASLMTVLFSEPRGGVFSLSRRIADGGADVRWWMVTDVATAVLTTVVCAVWLVGALRRWRRGQLSTPDQLGLVGCAVLAANAVMSYGYTKDMIMSAGGAAFAVVVWAAVRPLDAVAGGIWRRSFAAVVVAVLAVGWASRAAALPVTLMTEAFKTRNDWATVRVWLEAQRIDTSAPGAEALITTLRADALHRPVPHPSTPVGWLIDRR